jgi:hypothetical protein
MFTSNGNRFSNSADKFDNYVFKRGAATQFPSVAGENIALDEHHSDNEDSRVRASTYFEHQLSRFSCGATRDCPPRIRGPV